jgi:hypothetical protein
VTRKGKGNISRPLTSTKYSKNNLHGSATKTYYETIATKTILYLHIVPKEVDPNT